MGKDAGVAGTSISCESNGNNDSVSEMNELNELVGDESESVEVNDNVVGVRASSDSADSESTGTGESVGRTGLCATEYGDGGMVLIRLTDEGDPLVGRKIEVSNDSSANPSRRLIDKAEGEGCKIDDS